MFDPAVVNEGLGQADAAFTRQSARDRSMGGSPDGLGAYVNPAPEDAGYPYPEPTASSPYPPPVPQSYHARMAEQPMPMSGEIDFLEPETTSGGAALRSVGFTLLFCAVGTGVGYAWKGGLGAAAGLLLCGGLANVYRAQKWFEAGDPSERHEAMVSTVFAVGELGVGAYVGYKAYQAGEKKQK